MSYAVGKASQNSNTVKEYQAIFMFMGGFSLAIVPIIAWLLPNSPTNARMLRNGNDRLIALERIKENNTGTRTSVFKRDQFIETLKDPKTWMWAGMWFCAACPSGGIGAFGGLITKGFGFGEYLYTYCVHVLRENKLTWADTFTAILMQMPTGGIGIFGLLVGIFITNKIKMRWPVLA